MSEAIQVLLIILLVVTIGAVIKLFSVLGKLETTLTQTKAEIAGTLAKVETVAASTDTLMREELTPTLQVTRQTLSHLEVTTRAIAETSVALRGVTRKAEGAATVAAVVGGGGGALAKTATTLVASGVMAFIKNRMAKGKAQKNRERERAVITSKRK